MAGPKNDLKKEEVDIWRDTPVRYLGYANELGESFRALVHVNVVRLSYGVAFAYVFADTRSKTLAVKDNDNKKKAVAAADTLIWQTLASVAIPGFTINRLCALSLFLLSKNKALSLPLRKWTTTAIGLASIPIIIKPIDHLVDYWYANVVGETFRSLVGPSFVTFSHLVSFFYVFGDILNKTAAASNDKKFTSGLDVILWQSLASTIIPAFSLNGITSLSYFILKKTPLSPPMKIWTTTGIALASIPIIVKPIDHFSHLLMDSTFRQIFPL